MLFTRIYVYTLKIFFALVPFRNTLYVYRYACSGVPVLNTIPSRSPLGCSARNFASRRFSRNSNYITTMRKRAYTLIGTYYLTIKCVHCSRTIAVVTKRSGRVVGGFLFKFVSPSVLYGFPEKIRQKTRNERVSTQDTVVCTDVERVVLDVRYNRA